MKKLFLTPKILISVILVAIFSSSCVQPSVDKNSVLTTLKQYDPSLKVEHFVVSSVDLNDDNCQDAVVLMKQNSRYCGASGCVMLTLLCEDNKLKPIGKTTFVSPIISTSTDKTLGFKNIDVIVKPQGEKPYSVVLRYNGKVYPSNALRSPISPKRSIDKVLIK